MMLSLEKWKNWGLVYRYVYKKNEEMDMENWSEVYRVVCSGFQLPRLSGGVVLKTTRLWDFLAGIYRISLL